jgi:hypothetical protein
MSSKPLSIQAVRLLWPLVVFWEDSGERTKLPARTSTRSHWFARPGQEQIHVRSENGIEGEERGSHAAAKGRCVRPNAAAFLDR